MRSGSYPISGEYTLILLAKPIGPVVNPGDTNSCWPPSANLSSPFWLDIPILPLRSSQFSQQTWGVESLRSLLPTTKHHKKNWMPTPQPLNPSSGSTKKFPFSFASRRSFTNSAAVSAYSSPLGTIPATMS